MATKKASKGRFGGDPAAGARFGGDPLSTQLHEWSAVSDISAEQFFVCFVVFCVTVMLYFIFCINITEMIFCFNQNSSGFK